MSYADIRAPEPAPADVDERRTALQSQSTIELGAFARDSRAMTRGSARKLSRQLEKLTDEVVATHFPHPSFSSQLCVRGGSAMLPVEVRPVPIECEDARTVRAVDVLRSAQSGTLQVVVGMGLSALRSPYRTSGRPWLCRWRRGR